LKFLYSLINKKHIISYLLFLSLNNKNERFINQYDIKYYMKKKTRGREKLNVLDSIPLSEIILLIVSGVNYPLGIAKERGQKDSSPTTIQLTKLSDEEGIVKVQEERILKRTIYSINWNVLNNIFIDNIFNRLSQLYNEKLQEMGEYNAERQLERSKKLAKEKTISLEGIGKLTDYNLNEAYYFINDKKFNEEIRGNAYLIHLLQNFLKLMSKSPIKSKNKPLRQIFEDLIINLSRFKLEDSFLELPIYRKSEINEKLSKEELEPLEAHEKKLSSLINEMDVNYRSFSLLLRLIRYLFQNWESSDSIEQLQNYIQLKYSILYLENEPFTKIIVNRKESSENLRRIIKEMPEITKKIDNLLDENLKEEVNSLSKTILHYPKSLLLDTLNN
jgi:hypothetical protein